MSQPELVQSKEAKHYLSLRFCQHLLFQIMLDHLQQIILPFFLTKNKDTKPDKTFGLKSIWRKLYIQVKNVDFDGDGLIKNGNRFTGTPGLWELLVKSEPGDELMTEDKINYEEITVDTDSIRNPKTVNRLLSNKGFKWNTFIKPIWEKHVQKPKQTAKRLKKKQQTIEVVSKYYLEPESSASESSGSGFLPSDPNAFCGHLELLFASNYVLTTGVRNEIISICD